MPECGYLDKEAQKSLCSLGGLCGHIVMWAEEPAMNLGIIFFLSF